MDLNFSFKQMDPSAALREFAAEKSERLKKYFKGRIAVTWNFTIHKEGRIVHCHLVGNHMDYFGEAEHHDDFHVAIDHALDKIEKQLRKHKEIVKDHLHKAAAAGSGPGSEEEAE